MLRSIGRTKSELNAIAVATQSATEYNLRSTEHIVELLFDIFVRHPTDERLFTLTEESESGIS